MSKSAPGVVLVYGDRWQATWDGSSFELQERITVSPKDPTKTPKEPFRWVGRGYYGSLGAMLHSLHQRATAAHLEASDSVDLGDVVSMCATIKDDIMELGSKLQEAWRVRP